MTRWIKAAFIVYLGSLIGWWLFITTGSRQNTSTAYWFGAAYALIALIGAILGVFYVAREWGGYKSSIGKSVVFLSLGLFGLAFGQLVWSYYNVIAKVEVPYPSAADFGYFSIVPFYGTGMIILAKVGGAKLSLRKNSNKVLAFVVPAILLTVCYWIYLKGITVDTSNPVKTFLDFGQPLGEAAVISVAILTWQLSKNLLGGIMRRKIFMILFALVFQFLTDFLFYYQAARGEYKNGGLVDLLYTVSFTLMALSLLGLSASSLKQKAPKDIINPEADSA